MTEKKFVGPKDALHSDYISSDVGYSDEVLRAYVEYLEQQRTDLLGQARGPHAAEKGQFEEFGRYPWAIDYDDIRRLSYFATRQLSSRLLPGRWGTLHVTFHGEAFSSGGTEAEKVSHAESPRRPAYAGTMELSADTAADAISALDEIVKTATAIEDDDERYTELRSMLQRYLECYGQMGMLEISRLVLTSSLDEEFRAQVLAVVSRITHHDTMRYRTWLATRALDSDSIYVRYAATSALLQLDGDSRELRSVAAREPDPDLTSKMLRIADKLDQKKSATASSAY